MLMLLLGETSTATNTGANIITAVSSVTTPVTAVCLLVPALVQIRKVHKIVNQQRTDMMNFQRALIRALESHGIAVPVDQSLPPVPDSDPT